MLEKDIHSIHSKKLLILAAFIIFLNIFFLRNISHFGWTLLLIGTSISLTFGFLTAEEIKRNILTISLFGLTVGVFGLIFLTRANQTIEDLTFLLSLNLMLLAHYTLIKKRLPISSAEILSIFPRTFIQYFRSLGRTFFNKERHEGPAQIVFSSEKIKKVPWVSLVVGLFISFPILGVLTVLLSFGDPIFGKNVENFLNQEFIRELLPRLVLSIFFFIGLTPLLFIKHNDNFYNPANITRRLNLVNEFSVVMVLVSIVVGLFLLVQWKYIFIPPVSGVDLSKFGFSTYSEYVNRGFVELIAASTLIYILVWTGLIILRSPHATNKKVLKIVQFVVLSEFTIFLLSIFRRIYLYQHYHGLTLIRIYGGFFILLLLCYTAILIARHVAIKRWVLADIAVTLAIAFLLGIINVEGLIAKFPPTVNGQVDITYLARLSPDGYRGWEQAYASIVFTLSNESFPSKANYSFAVNPDQPKSSVPFSPEEQRQIAYAGVALEKLMENYNTLIFKYATEKELQEYLTELIEYSIKHIETTLESPTYKNPVTKITSDDFVKTKNRYEQGLKSYKDRLKITLSELKENKISPYDIGVVFYTPIDPYSRPVRVNFANTICMGFDVCTSVRRSYSGLSFQTPHSFYVIEKHPTNTKETRSWIDKTVSFNYSEFSAYKNMTKYMPISELLREQEKFFDYFRGIAATESVNPGTANYSADIDLNTPFLQKLQ